MSLICVVEGDPVPKGRPRFTRGGICYTPQQTRDYEKKVRIAAGLTMKNHSPFESALKVDVTAYVKMPKMSQKKEKEAINMRLFPAKKPDIDNLVKAALDGCNGVLWRDDALICSLSIRKYYSKQPRIEIRVQNMEEE